MSLENPYRSPTSPPLALPQQAAQRPTSYYRLWLGLAMLISLAQLRFRGVYEISDIALPTFTQWAMHPMVPLAALAIGIVLAQFSRRVSTEHRWWLSWTSLVMVTTLCLGYVVALYLPLLTIQASLE